MALRRSLYIVLVMAVAGISGLVGALVGAAAVYRALPSNPAGLPGATQASVPSSEAGPGQTLTLHMTDIEKGYFARPYMGISFQPIDPEIASIYNLPAEWGVYVTSVAPDGPAHRAGLQEGDIIVRLGDVALDETHSYVNALFAFQPGDRVMLDVVRRSERTRLEVTLGEAQLQ